MTKHKKNQNGSRWLPLLGLVVMGIFVFIVALFVRGKDIALLNPKGVIANEQYQLLIVSTSIMFGFAAIILFFIYFFAWRYRETNEKTVHNPNAGRSKLLMFTAWASPIMVFAILVSLLVPATHKLAPQKSIESNNEELVIRVIAMRWKWVFMYPRQDIATVNFVQIPVDTPVRFELTADEAPMNSFWIPHLGGMLYAMTEHVNPLNLMGDTPGDYNGGAAEINGHGFAGMKFTARVSTQADFDTWVSQTASESAELDATEYARLLEPTEDNPAVAYRSPTNRTLFDDLIKKYSGSHTHYKAPEHAESTGH